MNFKRWIALVVAAIVIVVSIGFQAVSSLASANWSEFAGGGSQTGGMEGIEEEELQPGDGSGNTIAVLDLQGVIQDTGEGSLFDAGGYNHQEFLYMLEQAGNSNDVDGIILKVNTPGGGVVESAEIHDAIVNVQEEYDKPVYITMGSQAASGGYYIAAPADKIVAHPATITGSIGVIMQSINYSELADNIGIEENSITSGEFKDIMSPGTEMSEEDEAILQSIVDDMYDDFVQVIADGRGIAEEEVREIGDGRIYTGDQAQEIDLVDDLGTMDDTVAFMEEEQDLEGARVVQYGASFSFNSFIGAGARSLFVRDAELLGIKELLTTSNSPRAMYLYTD